MQLSNPSSKTSINPLVFLLPVLVIIVLVFILIFVAPSGYSQIVTRIESYQKRKDVERVLTQKLATLQNAQPEVLGKTVQSVAVLPDKNPIFGVMSQIREASITNSVAIDQFKSNNVSDFGEGIQRLEFTVQVEAQELQSIAKFVQDLSKRAPISTVEVLDLKDESVQKSAEVKISTFWSVLPESLPEIEQPLAELSFDELRTLDTISQYTLPQFTVLPPKAEAERENPFN